MAHKPAFLSLYSSQQLTFGGANGDALPARGKFVFPAKNQLAMMLKVAIPTHSPSRLLSFVTNKRVRRFYLKGESDLQASSQNFLRSARRGCSLLAPFLPGAERELSTTLNA